LNAALSGECRFCGEEEDLEQLFLRCERLQSLFKLLKEWFREFNEDFIEIWWFNYVLCTIYDDVMVLNLNFFLYICGLKYVLILLCNV